MNAATIPVNAASVAMKANQPLLQLRLPLWRSRFMMVILFLAFATLIGRAVYLQAWANDFLQEEGEARTQRIVEVSGVRGKITDRHGEVFASSTEVKSVYASLEDIRIGITPKENTESARKRADRNAQALKQLAPLLGISEAELYRRIGGGQRSAEKGERRRDFVRWARQLPPELADKIAALKIDGIHLQREYKRTYPAGEVAAHVIGFTGIDENGQEGIELAMQESLAGQAGSRRVIKDRRGNIVEDVASIQASRQGQELALSIDSKIQYLAYSQLKQAVEAHKAKAGGIVVLDARTGEVLALANLPTYNPNARAQLTGAQLRNRVLTDEFEPGSTMKPFTAALALELGQVRPSTVIQTAPGRMTIGNATISDAHPHGAMSVAEIIQKSSNVGTVKMAMNIERADMWELYRKVGLGQQPPLQFPGASPGRLRDWKKWRPIEQATMSYGYGLSVSLLQIARAYSIFARDGDLMPVTFTKRDGPVLGQPVISSETARELRTMLAAAATAGGTAPKAQTMGYSVAGKTGTAHKQEGGGYAEKKYRSSFVGFAPAREPRLIIAVMIDEPSNGKYYGGDVAAPVFSAVSGGALRVLGVAPDLPMKPIVLPPEDREIRESLGVSLAKSE